METFSPVVSFDSIRLLIGLAAQFRLTVHHVDIKTAFLNGKLNEEVLYHFQRVPMERKMGDCSDLRRVYMD